MQLPDVNVLVRAHREDASEHALNLAWLEGVANGAEAFGLSELVCSSFLRVTTHPSIFPVPTPLDIAVDFIHRLRERPNCVPIAPGERHWQIFVDLCRQSQARGNLIADAYFAALAIESGSEWITNDGDYARFPGLRWRRP